MDSLKLGLIGCGVIARVVHLPLLNRLPGHELVALADNDAASLDKARMISPNAARYDSIERLLDDDRIEAVIICLPTDLHASAATAALVRGKHVYLEKPLANTIDEGKQLVDLAKNAGKVAMCGLNFRFNAMHIAARELIQSGKLGEIVAVRSVFSAAPGELPIWKRSRARGGGVLMDMGTHHIDLARFMFDSEIVEATATFQSKVTEDDTTFLEMRLANGVTVQSFFSFCATSEDRWEFFGTGKKLLLDRYRYSQVELTDDKSDSSIPEILGKRFRRAPGRLRKILNHGYEPSYKECFSRFIQAARENTPVTPDFEDGFYALSVIEAAERSFKNKAPAAVPT